MAFEIIKKILICVFSLLSLVFGLSTYASDFIAPNSSGEPILIDISNLNITSSIDVTVGDFTDQPRPYRDNNTKSLVISSPAVSSSEKTIKIEAGGSSVTKTVSFRSSPSGILKNSLLPPLREARGGNTATKISDGRVVLIGGSKALAEDPLNTLEIFNPETGKADFLKTPDELNSAHLITPRSQHTATYIGINSVPVGMIAGPVEQILVIGGFSKNGQIENTIEIVEIKVGTVQCTSTLLTNKKSKLKKGRIFHTASLLPDGRVLIVGGQGKISMSNLGALNSIEIFDPVSKLIQQAEISLKSARLLHTATTLQDGNILIIGGFTNEKQDEFGFGPATDTSELIDSSTLTIKKIGLLKEATGGHSAILLTNGLVFVTGGSSDFFSARTKEDFKGLSKSTIQFYDNKNEVFNFVSNNTGGNLELQIPRFLHQSVLLPNGNIAVIGGLNIKAGLNSTSLISTPISTIEVFDVDLLTFSGNLLKAEKKVNLETFSGRILPTAILVTPKNKSQGFLSSSDSSNFTNSAIYLTGGYTNGFGKTPTKVSEFIQIESNNTIEGRQIKLTPEALIQGSYLSELVVELDKFTKVPSLRVEPQTVNLSSSNNFMASAKVISTNNQIALLKSENTDTTGSVIVSPSLFQVGENIIISRKDTSVKGDFEINILPVDPKNDFISAKVKVHVSESSEPFLSTNPPYGISLSNQEGINSEKVTLKVLSQDGLTELTSIPATTQITATILDPLVANLGGSGISSITGTLSTQYTVNALKPGKTNLTFSTNFQDVLPLTIPISVSGTPSFSNTPIDAAVLSNLSLSGIEFSKTKKTNSTSVSIEDLRLSANSSLFPIYIPINLQSSIDSSNIPSTFTIRPIFGIDLFTAIPRTLVNGSETDFRQPLTSNVTTIGGIVPSDILQKPIAVLASDDGLRTILYGKSSSENISDSFNKISEDGNIKKLKLFESQDNSNNIKIAALEGSMVLVLDAVTGNVESQRNLSDTGFEIELTKVDGQIAGVVSVGTMGIDLVFPLTDSNPRVVNFRTLGNTMKITVVEKLSDKQGPFAISYDGLNTFSIVNLINVDEPIQTISTGGEKITKIDYAGRFTVNDKVTDVLAATSQRKVLLFDLNKRTSIPVKNSERLVKSQIEDLVVIDGIAYLALGTGGVLAVSIGSLLSNSNSTSGILASFKKNKLTVVKQSGKETILTKPLSASILADSKPFLLTGGQENNLTVIRVSP